MVFCAANKCSNSTAKKSKKQLKLEQSGKKITFHLFPKEVKRREEWVKAVGKDNWCPSANSALCSLHFKESDIDRTSLVRVRLRENVIPSIFERPSTSEVVPTYVRKKPIILKSKKFVSRKPQKLPNEVQPSTSAISLVKHESSSHSKSTSTLHLPNKPEPSTSDIKRANTTFSSPTSDLLLSKKHLTQPTSTQQSSKKPEASTSDIADKKTSKSNPTLELPHLKKHLMQLTSISTQHHPPESEPSPPDTIDRKISTSSSSTTELLPLKKRLIDLKGSEPSSITNKPASTTSSSTSDLTISKKCLIIKSTSISIQEKLSTSDITERTISTPGAPAAELKHLKKDLTQPISISLQESPIKLEPSTLGITNKQISICSSPTSVIVPLKEQSTSICTQESPIESTLSTSDNAKRAISTPSFQSSDLAPLTKHLVQPPSISTQKSPNETEPSPAISEFSLLRKCLTQSTSVSPKIKLKSIDKISISPEVEQTPATSMCPRTEISINFTKEMMKQTYEIKLKEKENKIRALQKSIVRRNKIINNLSHKLKELKDKNLLTAESYDVIKKYLKRI